MRLLDAIELGLGFGGGGETHFGVVGIMTGAATIFFAYLGFDAVSTAAEETRNPQRDLPIGILGSLAICTVLYIVVRSEARRVGKECVSTCRSRWAPHH